MHNFTAEEMRILDDVAGRHEMSLDAVVALFRALAEGNGRQAQFNHPDLGGMGQWSQGGMIMIGDMFNQSLRHRVDALCNELADLMRSRPSFSAEPGPFQSQSRGGESLFVRGAGLNSWWPAELTGPASTGAQNDLRYAYFPGSRRLAIQQNGAVLVYDAGNHIISGFSQQQGGDQSLTFTSQFGLVRVADLPIVSAREGQPREPSTSAAAEPPTRSTPVPSAETNAAPIALAPHIAPRPTDDILATIERLAELRQKNILTEEEFATKKAELLSRI
jgi:hypothetical protein